jgi:surface-anchored protein
MDEPTSVGSRRFASRQARWTGRRPRAAGASLAVLALAGSIVAGSAPAGAAPSGADGEVMVALAHATQPGVDSTTYEHLLYNPVTDRVLYMRDGDGLSVRDPASLAETTTVAARYSGNTWPGQLVVDPRNGWVYQSTRRSAGRLNLLVPGSDGSMTVRPLGADGHNLPLPATSLWRMAIEPATGALHIATSSGGAVSRVEPTGGDPDSAASFRASEQTGAPGVEDFVFVAEGTAVAALTSPLAGSSFAVLRFSATTVTATPIDWAPTHAMRRVAAAGDGTAYLVAGTEVQRFRIDGSTATAVEPRVSLPYAAFGVAADPATGTLFAGSAARNTMRIDKVRDGVLVGTVSRPRIGAGQTKLALDGRGGAVAVNDGELIRVGQGVAVPPPQPQPPDLPIVMDVGHLDVAPILLPSGLDIYVKDGTQPGLPRWHPLEHTVFHVKPLDSARTTVPEASPLVPYLGPAGTPIWQLPVDSAPDLLWPGFSTEQPRTDLPGPTQLRLTGFSGPGAFALSTTNDDVVMSSGDPALSYTLTAGSHAHAGWSFTREGVYRLTITASSTTAWGEDVQVNRTLAVAVGSVDPRTVTPGSGEPAASQTITVPVTTDGGALILSVNPDDRDVTLSDAFLTPSGDRLASDGSLRPITVTDTRAARPGWNVSGQVTDFATSVGDRFGGQYLGWTPAVVSSAPGQNVVPGTTVAPGSSDGPGLSTGATLATAAPGGGLGTARLGAGLRLELPTETAPGIYRAVLTLTAI